MSQGWSKIFNRINWLNRPSTNTPLNATNLNAGDSAIDKLDDRIITLDTVKADMQVVNGMVADVSLNSNTGVITVTYKNGSHVDYDTNLEKIAVNFSYDYVNQRLVLTLSDGSKQYVDMSALITQYEFKDSTTIAFSVDSTGKISASVKNGSITEAMLETGYLANIKVEVAKAEAAATQAQSSEASSDYNAKLSRSYAIGGSGIREGEDTDNAMYYYEQAKKTDIGQIRSEVDELNSNLDTLEFGKISGSKNIINIPNPLTISGAWYKSYNFKCKRNTSYILSFSTDSYTVNRGCAIYDLNGTVVCNFSYSNITFNSGDNEELCLYLYCGTDTSGTSIYSNIQIEEGTIATDYEPYIPSVKMLADEVNQQNESLEDYGIDNKFDGIWYQAYRDSATSIVSNNENVCSNVFRCNAGDVVKLNYSNSNQTIYLQFWKSDGSSLSEQFIVGNKLELVAPQDASYVSIDISDIGITPQNVGNVTLYIANEIDQLKNDLSSLGCEIAFGDVDFNNLTNKMVYAINGTCTNAPKTTTPIHGILIVFKASNDIISQLYHDSDGTLYNRMYWGGTWGSWK